MKRHILSGLTAAMVALCMLLTPARALTVDQARELLNENYVDVIDPQVLAEPTIDGILAALSDPYTDYLDPSEYADFLTTMEDETLCGIGATSHQDEGGLLIDEIIEGSPAQAAGLEPGDLMVAVDGVSVADMDLDQAVALIRGEEGTQVRITYLRQGKGLRRTATLTRAVIVVPATTGRVLEGGVGYIDCDTWGQDTLGHFRDLMGEMEEQVGCWLIDLRDNGGGLTDAAAQTAGLFCGTGTMLSLRFRGESEDGYAYEPFEARIGPITKKPVVLLINENTASASESFAAALRDYGVAVSVGERTFGKGVAQGLWDKDVEPELFADGDCLKITMARFYSPLGNTNDTLGVLPEVPADETESAAVALGLAQRLAESGEKWRTWYEGFLLEMTAAAAFSDCAGSPYADAITSLAAHGLVAGKGDGLFHPEDTLTRGELAQLLCNALNSWIPLTPADFEDVAEDAWYGEAVSAIVAQGFMEGVAPGRFAPEETLTRQELFTVMGRLARWLNDDLDFSARRAGEETTQLRVLEGYAPWARPSVWLLSCAMEDVDRGEVNLLWDAPERIDPTAPATRQEAAQVLHTLLYYLRILP